MYMLLHYQPIRWRMNQGCACIIKRIRSKIRSRLILAVIQSNVDPVFQTINDIPLTIDAVEKF